MNESFFKGYCRNIEPGKTSIGTIMTDGEQKHIARTTKASGGGRFWIGGARVAERFWFWYRHKTGSPPFLEQIPDDLLGVTVTLVIIEAALQDRIILPEATSDEIVSKHKYNATETRT